jgi:hypothetical protein
MEGWRRRYAGASLPLRLKRNPGVVPISSAFMSDFLSFRDASAGEIV